MKFWTMILGFVTALGVKYGFKVDPDVFWSVVGLFGLLIGAQGLTDHGKEAAIEQTKQALLSNVTVDMSKVPEKYKL